MIRGDIWDIIYSWQMWVQSRTVGRHSQMQIMNRLAACRPVRQKCGDLPSPEAASPPAPPHWGTTSRSSARTTCWPGSTWRGAQSGAPGVDTGSVDTALAPPRPLPPSLPSRPGSDRPAPSHLLHWRTCRWRPAPAARPVSRSPSYTARTWSSCTRAPTPRYWQGPSTVCCETENICKTHFQLDIKSLNRKVIKRKSATVNLENLLMEKFLREKENKKNLLEVCSDQL